MLLGMTPWVVSVVSRFWDRGGGLLSREVFQST